MSRMSQVIQIGNIDGDIHYYIEDYAYTYLKKQKGKEKTKYFLYGEKEENGNKKKIYIYGIAGKPKMEQTYFKEYYPLGFLKIKNNESYWITLKGQEQKINGYYIFYAPNQAMQEYLVDHREEENVPETDNKEKRHVTGEILPMKETFVPARKMKKNKKGEFRNEKFWFPIGGIVVAGLVLLVLTSANGRKKVEIFRQVIAQNMPGIMEDTFEEEFVIENKDVEELEKQKDSYVEDVSNSTENNLIQNPESKENKNIVEDMKTEEQKLPINTDEKNKEEKVEISEIAEINYEEYIVENGDTLAAICKSRYGSLSKMEEICTINNIKNADYIAPGQKLYLP